jgi:hypothetical protein
VSGASGSRAFLAFQVRHYSRKARTADCRSTVSPPSYLPPFSHGNAAENLPYPRYVYRAVMPQRYFPNRDPGISLCFRQRLDDRLFSQRLIHYDAVPHRLLDYYPPLTKQDSVAAVNPFDNTSDYFTLSNFYRGQYLIHV